MNGRLILWGLGMLIVGNINAQVFDDFSDGNFNQDPVWTGDSLKFEVNTAKQLHLKSTGNDTAVLVTEQNLTDSLEWLIWVKCTFSPSGSNFTRIYLMSDQADLTANLHGYYLQLGEAGSADAVELFRQDGDIHTSLCRGPDAMVAASFTLRIRVLRTASGLFEVYADPLGGQNFSLLASATDNTFNSAGIFGFFCSHTSSNATKFYFDEVEIRHIYQDVNPPELQQLITLDDYRIQLVFDEPVLESALTDPDNFMVNYGIGLPIQCIADTLSGTSTTLIFHVDFPTDTILSLSIRNITDLNNNISPLILKEFVYHPIRQFDLVINEIMADPEPQTGLPPVEYIELYNRSAFPIQLRGWKLYTSDNPVEIPECEIQSHAYMVLCHINYTAFMMNYGQVKGLSSFSLSNSGSTIRLVNEHNHLISVVTWNPEWHQNSIKADGGFSLEQIDPMNPCGEKENWTSSVDPRGGTPGKINSVYQSNPDLSPPLIRKVVVEDETHLQIYFSEEMDSLDISKPEIYAISPGIGNPLFASFSSKTFNRISLELEVPLVTGIRYTLEISGLMRDCAGNILENLMTYEIGVPELPDNRDIIINEIMFDPGIYGAEFIELYNRSEKTIDLKDLLIAKPGVDPEKWDVLQVLSTEGRQILPDGYLVLTEEPDMVKSAWQTSNPAGFEKTTSFPSLLNEEDELYLLDVNEQVIDSVYYSNTWHHPMLANTAGVSLEKISPDLPSREKSSWHSAATSAGYATPAFMNSQYSPADTVQVEIQAEPAVFSPDNDGYQDQLDISFHLSVPGYQAMVDVFNDAGMCVATILQNELMGTDFHYFWNGCDPSGRILPQGIYILNFRLIHPEGLILQQKKAVALTMRL
jgi:hypothetical protein